MSDDTQTLPLNFLKSADSVIRNQSLGAATSLIDYHSEGQCLVIAPVELALSLAEELAPLKVTVLDTTDGASGQRPGKRLTAEGIAVYSGGRPAVTGHLGAFSVTFADGDRVHDLAVMETLATGCFDLVLDTSDPPLVEARLPPFGYRAVPVPDATSEPVTPQLQERLLEVTAEFKELIGDFDKPRYFDYNAGICAHQRSRLSGCTNCIDICATGAIRTSGEGVEVDPYLCQGCGSCATVCPTGAMTYAYPRASDAISRTREMLDKHTGDCSILLLYRQSEEDADVQFESTLPEFVLPVAVEEVTAFGIDYWASMLAAGLNHIVLYLPTEVTATDSHPVDGDDSEQMALEHQASILHRILEGLGLDQCGVQRVTEPADLNPRLHALNGPVREAGPGFATHDNKRQTFRTAIDALASGHPARSDTVDLPEHSPFGTLLVNKEACTLCMACVSTCPAAALLDGQDMPKLRFIEASCVQCGLCAQACPESAIELQPSYRYDSVAAREIVTLNEEEPFNCVRCHKPFATRKMIDTMSAKLAGHWMFGDEQAVRRLKMCEDCRVVDIFESDASGIQVHRDD
ncbi:MAG: 4Fe-4S binding protein [Gammaproteobacteria bacterium]|nr:4Fe-4S binding protein [Gammaproteobacteria bacterium]